MFKNPILITLLDQLYYKTQSLEFVFLFFFANITHEMTKMENSNIELDPAMCKFQT
jgi:hypothetical protein